MLNAKIKKAGVSGLLFIFLFSYFAPVFASLSIKDDYCGVAMYYMYCKCAFHGNQKDDKWCDKVGMVQEAANEYVWSSFEAWKLELERRCVADGGTWLDEQCMYPPKCSSREVIVDWNCHPISEFCGPDPVILYNLENKQCYCPEFYDLEKEDGEKKCIAQEEILLEVEILEGNPRPPLLADGENYTRLKIKGTYIESGNPVEFSFSLPRHPDRATGYISLEQLDPKNGTIIFYGTPDLKWEEPGVFVDSLYLSYYSYLKEKNEQEKFSIVLYNSEAETMVISRTGFEDRTVPLLFEGKWMDVYVYTIAGGKTYPVVGAEINYQQSWKETTNWDGMASLYNHRFEGGDTRKKFRVDLYLEPSLRLKINRAQGHYDEIKIPTGVISNFLRNYAGYLAVEEDMAYIENMETLLKATDYSLFFIAKGHELSDDTTKILGDTLGMILWDAFDFVISLDSFTNKIKSIFGKWGDKLWDQFDSLPEPTQEDIIELQYFLKKWGTDPLKKVWQEMVVSMLEGADYFTPDTFNYILKELSKKVAKVLAMQEGQNLFDKLSIKEFTTSALRTIDNGMFTTLMNKVADKLRRRTVIPQILESEIELAQERYVAFADKYINFHEAEYNTTMFKAYSELLLDMGSDILQFGTLVLAPGFFPAVKAGCAVVDKAYKGIRVAIIDVGQLVDWLNIYFKNRNSVIENVAKVMQIYYSYGNANENRLVLADVVQAAEQESGLDLSFDQETMEILQAIADNKVPANDPNRAKVFDYLHNKISLEFYEGLSEMVRLTANLAPDDQELQQYKQELEKIVEGLEQEVKSGKKEVKKLDIVKEPDKPSESIISENLDKVKIFISQVKAIFSRSNEMVLILSGAFILFLLIFLLGILLHKKKLLVVGLILGLIALSNIIVWIITNPVKGPDFNDFNVGPNSADFVDVSSFNALEDIE